MDEYKIINYKSLLTFILKKFWVIALTALVFGIVAFFITQYAITPMYRATIRLYANNKTEASSSLTSSDVSASKSLVDTYISIIQSDTVIGKIAETTKHGYRNEEILKMMSAKSINGTEVFEVSITGPSPQDSADIANAIADFAPGKISEIVEGSSVKVIDRAGQPSEPVSPSSPKNVVAAVLLGIAISAVVLFFIFISDTTIYSEEDIKKFCTLSILGVLPDLAQASQSKSYYSYRYGGRSSGK